MNLSPSQVHRFWREWADACKANNKIWRQKRMGELAAAFEQNLKDTTDAFWYLGAMQEVSGTLQQHTFVILYIVVFE